MEILPVFTTHHSIGESILTVEKEEKIKKTQPVSVFAIAKTHGEEGIFVAENDMSSYWKLYKNSKALGVQLVFGLKICVCADMKDKDDTSEKTESNVIVVFKNSKAYYDFVPIYSLASIVGDRKGRRLDWQTLKERWTENFDLYLPFYSSFVARNLCVLDSKCFPDFGDIKPTFLSCEYHDLPFDEMIREGIKKYAKSEGFDIQPAHQIYYYKDSDVMKHLSFKCIQSSKHVANWDKPNLDHYGSDQFSYESYRAAIGKPI